jgi:hypothetical protein
MRAEHKTIVPSRHSRVVDHTKIKRAFVIAYVTRWKQIEMFQNEIPHPVKQETRVV